MKMLEKEGATALSAKVLNLTGDVKEVLKTLILLEKNFGATYVARVLRGDDAYALKDDNHKQLETWGVFSAHSQQHVKSLIILIGELGFLTPTNVYASTLSITDKGRQFLDKCWDITVLPYKLRMNKFDFILRNRISTLRDRLANAANHAPYMVFTDWAIEQIVRKRPVTLAELKRIQGITPHKAENFGEAILLHVKEVEAMRQEEMMATYQRQMRGELAQGVKRLFNEGYNIPQIAEKLQMKLANVSIYLERLHLCGHLDLKPFIERTMDSKVLYKGAEYFRKVQSPKLKEAYESLGLDYDTLRFCRLYVSDFQQKSEQIPLSA